MKLHKVIAFFLILVLSIQLLPVKRIAAWLLSGQVTEELAETKGDSKSGGHDAGKYFLPGNNCVDQLHYFRTTTAVSHAAESLEARHADDIPTPPPNC